MYMMNLENLKRDRKMCWMLKRIKNQRDKRMKLREFHAKIRNYKLKEIRLMTSYQSRMMN